MPQSRGVLVVEPLHRGGLAILLGLRRCAAAPGLEVIRQRAVAVAGEIGCSNVRFGARRHILYSFRCVGAPSSQLNRLRQCSIWPDGSAALIHYTFRGEAAGQLAMQPGRPRFPNTDNGIREDPSAGSATASSGATSLYLGASRAPCTCRWP